MYFGPCGWLVGWVARPGEDCRAAAIEVRLPTRSTASDHRPLISDLKRCRRPDGGQFERDGNFGRLKFHTSWYSRLRQCRRGVAGERQGSGVAGEGRQGFQTLDERS